MFRQSRHRFITFLISAIAAGGAFCASDPDVDVQYGVDCSFPIHSWDLKCGSALGDRQGIYEDFIEGCREKYAELCDLSEEKRISRALMQPQFALNHTVEGYALTRAPDAEYKKLIDFWRNNRYRIQEERWPAGATEINHWESPSYVVKLGGQRGLRGGGDDGLQEALQSAVQRQIEEWLGLDITPTGMYGIRIHTNGAVVPPHVGRTKESISATINVAQDLREDWVFELIHRDGDAVNVTLKPGEVLMFESGSLIHGHPFALKGRYFASVFFHFEFTPESEFAPPVNAPWHEALESPHARSRNPEPVSPPAEPASRQPRTAEASRWTPNLPQGEQVSHNTNDSVGVWPPKPPQGRKEEEVPVSPVCHIAARNGDLATVSLYADVHREALVRKDKNGWEPIHEAARSGHLDIVKFLVRNGADVNTISNFGRGYSPLRIAKNHLNPNHPLLAYFLSLGAVDRQPADWK